MKVKSRSRDEEVEVQVSAGLRQTTDRTVPDYLQVKPDRRVLLRQLVHAEPQLCQHLANHRKGRHSKGPIRKQKETKTGGVEECLIMSGYISETLKTHSFVFPYI